MTGMIGGCLGAAMLHRGGVNGCGNRGAMVETETERRKDQRQRKHQEREWPRVHEIPVQTLRSRDNGGRVSRFPVRRELSRIGQH